MPAPPRLLLPNSVVFITSRMEEGLPLVPCAFINRILEGIVARAQVLYPVCIVAMKFMSNHLHMLMVVRNPDDVVGFMDRVKTELSHAINRLLGRRRRTVWQAGYDSPAMLTIGNVIKKLVYLYTNAQAADLVDTIEEYPGVSSWRMFTTGVVRIVCKWIRRPMIPKLLSTKLSIEEQERLARQLCNLATQEHTLTLDAEAWTPLFGITSDKEKAHYRKLIIDGVREEEERLRRKRAAEGKEVLGAEKLMTQPMDAPYSPKKFGRRMWCICSDRDLRRAFIAYVKSLLAQARAVLARWRQGDTQAKYPPGLFPPSMPKLANLLPQF